MARKLKWGPEELAHIKMQYEDFASDGTEHIVSTMAILHGVSRIRIYQVLKQAGVDIKAGKVNAEVVADVLQP